MYHINTKGISPIFEQNPWGGMALLMTRSCVVFLHFDQLYSHGRHLQRGWQWGSRLTTVDGKIQIPS